MVSDADLLERVRTRLVANGATPTRAAVAAALRSEGGVRGDAEIAAVLTRLTSELVGTGPLETLLLDPDVTDVLVNAPDEVWVDRGAGLARVRVRLAGEDAVRRLAQRLAAATGRRLDDAQPFVDARLPGGVRLHAVLPPVSPRGTTVSLRVPRRQVFTLAELVASGSASPPLAKLLGLIVTSRLAFLISGGTGTGKTTLLSALLSCADPADRVLLVEDSGELRPQCPHVVRLEARTENAEGAGEVTLRDLVRQALRMRPDRIVVGEVRGAEVADLLAALNTGHEGGCGTVHANSAADVPARLEALGAVAGMSRPALHSQLMAALDVVIHLHRGADGLRRVAEVDLLEAGPDGLVATTAAVTFRRGETVTGPGAAVLRRQLEDRGVASEELVAAGLGSASTTDSG
ncbi:MAG: TadA family conjugal transfer-associated ATPase [Frankiaceae bacterium]